MTAALALLLSGLRLSIPLLFAALGGLLSERSGIANIALEGFILVGAFSSATITSLTGDPYIGLAGGVFFWCLVGFTFRNNDRDFSWRSYCDGNCF
jgi:simple sugar transport system permease protein